MAKRATIRKKGKRTNPWPFSRPDARRTTPASGGIAYHSAKRRPATAKKAATAGKKGGGLSVPDERTIQEGFKRGLTLNEILQGNPSLRKTRASNPSKFDRCVRAVQAKGGAVSPYAVCTAAETRNAPKSKTIQRWFVVDTQGVKLGGPYASFTEARKQERPLGGYAVKLGHRVKLNPAAASAEVFEDFHGFKPSEVVTVTKKVHHHKHLASLGILVYLEVWGIDKVGHTLNGFGEALLACNEDRNQLFIEGGDQALDLEVFGIKQPHELETIGKVLTVAYATDKKHLGKEGGKAVYVHDFTTTNENGKHVKVPEARLPQLIYDVRNEQLLFSGGSYEILREGIDK